GSHQMIAPFVLHYNNGFNFGVVGYLSQNSAQTTDGAMLGFQKTMSSAGVVTYNFGTLGVGSNHHITIGSNTYNYTEVSGDTGTTIAAALAQLINASDPNATAMQPRAGGSLITTNVVLSPLGS